MKSWILSLLLLLLLFSCSIEKRVYKRGYFIQWHHAQAPNQRIPDAENADTQVVSNTTDSSGMKAELSQTQTEDSDYKQASPAETFDVDASPEESIPKAVPTQVSPSNSGTIDEPDLTEEERDHIERTKK